MELCTPTERRICSRRQRCGASALGYIHITVIGRVPLHAIRVLRYFYLYVCSRDKNSIQIAYVHRLCSASSQYLYPRRSALRHAAQPSVPHTPQRPTQFRTTTPPKRCPPPPILLLRFHPALSIFTISNLYICPIFVLSYEIFTSARNPPQKPSPFLGICFKFRPKTPRLSTYSQFMELKHRKYTDFIIILSHNIPTITKQT